MAKITLGPIVQSVRGSIGGVTFRQVGAKFYAGPKSSGPVAAGRTSAEHHQYLKMATASWGTLAAPVKEFWARYHALDNPRHPRSGLTFATPYALYVCYQMMRLHCGAAMLTATIPEPPVFVAGAEIRGVWPFSQAVFPYGVMQGYNTQDAFMDSACFFVVTSRDGKIPGKFPKKVFPAFGYGPGVDVRKSNWLIYQALGYPAGLQGLVTQTAPATPLYMASGWGLEGNQIQVAPWTLPFSRGTEFLWPVETPIVEN